MVSNVNVLLVNHIHEQNCTRKISCRQYSAAVALQHAPQKAGNDEVGMSDYAAVICYFCAG